MKRYVMKSKPGVGEIRPSGLPVPVETKPIAPREFLERVGEWRDER